MFGLTKRSKSIRNKNNKCEYTLSKKGKIYYEHSGCGIRFEVQNHKNWKIGHNEYCPYCNFESINVKNRTTKK
jgi:hypothetical protein